MAWCGVKMIHIITSLEKGGAEEMLKRFLMALDKGQEKNVIVVALTGKKRTDDDLIRRGYDVRFLDISNMKSLVGLFRLYFILLKFRPDVIQTWLYHSDLIGGLLGRMAFVSKIVWNIRCEALRPERAGRMTMVVFNICKILSYFIPSKIVCVGERAMKTHIQSGFCERKMTVIENGYDHNRFHFSIHNRKKIRDELGVSENEIIVGSVGRFHRDKGQDLLLKAAVSVLKNNTQVKFVFVGRDCSYQNSSIENLRISEALRSRILLLGEKSNIDEMLSAFDIYCMPSRSEGFPNSLAEAMLTELPCIASDVGDANVLSSGTARLIEPGRIDLLAVEIEKMIDLPKEERIAIGKKAREQVVKNFSIVTARDKFNALYSKLTKV